MSRVCYTNPLVVICFDIHCWTNLRKLSEWLVDILGVDPFEAENKCYNIIGIHVKFNYQKS